MLIMSSRRSAGLVSAALILSACAGRQQVDPDAPGLGGVPVDAPRTGAVGAFGNPAAIYQRMGLLAPAGPVAFVGTVRFVATARPDSTLALLAVSLQNRALTFARDDDRYRATYEVRAEFRRGTQVVRRVEAQQVVRVANLRETTRGDESVIFQQTLPLAPGLYTLSLAVRDGGSVRSAVQEATVTVPPLGAAGLSSPITIYEATPRASTDSAPRLVVSPRATFTFGRDTAASVYLEGYGAGTTLPLRLTARGDRGALLWTDTVSLARRGGLFSGVVPVPLAPLGVGRVVTLVANRADARDSSGTPMFVTFGDELPVTTFEEMLGYLRYFADGRRLAALRDAPASGRAAAWGEFFRATDPTPTTPENEALRDYFGRVALANARYREEGGNGWLTDRGRVYVTVGDPDQIYQQGGAADVNTRGRAQIWEYRDDRIQLVFIDQSGFGRWRLTAASEGDFQSLARRRGPGRTGG
jgi:GWxTD domain-containing protein